MWKSEWKKQLYHKGILKEIAQTVCMLIFGIEMTMDE